MSLRVFELGLDVLEALLDVAEKSVAGYVRDYRVSISQLAADVFNGDKTSQQFASGLRTLIRSEARPTYEEGMREGGSKDPEVDMEDADEQIVAGWIDEQLGYVDNFAAAVREAKDAPIPSGSPAGVSQDELNRSAQQAIFDRVEVWGQSLDNLGALGRLSALGNIALTFDGDDGAESCVDCQRYKGQRHRYKTWEKMGLLKRNGNENFACGRFDNCHHGFYNDDGELIVP